MNCLRNTSGGLPMWRIMSFDLLQELRGLLGAAASLDITQGNNAHAGSLVHLALDLLDEHEDFRRNASGDDYYGECFGRVHAVLIGARDMTEISPAMKAVLSVACDKAEEISRVLDEAGFSSRN